MSLIPSPGGVPGDLSQATGAVPLCDLGPEFENKIPPAAWVNVSIRAAVPGEAAPDAAGRFLHCVFEFAHPRVTVGKRRSVVANWAPSLPAKLKAQDPIFVECDPGCYWIGTPCNVRFTGGRKGDLYDVAVTIDVTRQVQKPSDSFDTFEDPFRFALTSVVTYNALSPALPTPPQWHTDFELIQGGVTVAGFPLTNYGPGARVPLNMGPILLTENSIVRTVGAL